MSDLRAVIVEGSLFRRMWSALRRSFLTILICLPSVLVIGTTLVLWGVAASTSHDQLIASYQREAERTGQAKDHARSGICFERLTSLEPTRKDFQFRLAQELSALGDAELATTLLTRLAPIDEPGYPEAQVWRATRLLQGEIDRNDLTDAELHLKQAINGQPDNPTARRLLGQLYFRVGRLEEAERQLVQVVQRHPEVRLLLSTIAREQGKREQSLSWAKSAEKHYRELLTSNPNIIQARALLSASLGLQDDFPSAVQVLTDGLARDNAEGLRNALGELYARWYDVRSKDAPEDLGGRLAVLEQGLRHDPANLALMDRISHLMGDDSKEAEKARAVLRELLTTGKATAGAHFVLGIDAYRRQKLEEARFHWEHALEIAPRFAAVANNLAWLLADGDNADLERALALIDAALQSNPGQPEFHGTRGHVLVRLKRWREAVREIEVGLAANSNNPELQSDFADAYDGLGLPHLARPYRDKAQAIRADAARKRSEPGKP